MVGYIRVGELAKKLGTSNQKLGKLIKALNIKGKKKNTGTSTHVYITFADSKILEQEIKDFREGCGRPKGSINKPNRNNKKAKQKTHDNSYTLFIHPIMMVDIASGLVSGPGIWQWLADNRYRVVGNA